MPEPEATLIRQAQKGDHDAFASLVDEHQRYIYNLALRVLRDENEALDLTQETFVRAWASLRTFDAAQPFVPWVLRIARNHCIDVIRRRLPAARRVELDGGGEGEARIELPDAARPGADEAMERAQMTRALDAAVQQLPERYREVVHLFHVEQLSYKEIAQAMEIPIGTVMTWLHRARAQLRVELGRETP